MAAYLIDYENVHRNGLNGIKKLTEADTVIIFVGNRISDVPIDAVHDMLSTPAQVTLKKTRKTAKDYLDFQLATCLGGLVERGGDKEFYIISGDRGFEAVVDYWRSNKANVSVKQRISISPQQPPETEKAGEADTPAAKLDNATKKKIRDLVKSEKLSPGNYNGIYNLFMNENDKQALHTGLVRLFEQKRGSHIYNLLKDEFDQYKASAR
ncbi:MAG: hypothetical protein LBG29_07480 [Synergistaceae bacterium]|jgi:hypothetical protein|nr:hypothetical protein [Synergistaceae bacterium]